MISPKATQQFREKTLKKHKTHKKLKWPILNKFEFILGPAVAVVVVVVVVA